MRDEREEQQKRQVGFRNVRSPEVFVKEGVPLQELDDWIDQVGEQDGEREDYENGASNAQDKNNDCEEQGGRQDVERATIRESHAPPAFKITQPRELTSWSLQFLLD